jgi:hypothetical protein
MAVIPAVALFSLPGGSILLPVLAEAIDRRKTRRLLRKKDPTAMTEDPWKRN